MKATITTTIPVRNGQEFIARTLESLARQTRKADRIVVLDNHSTDDTEKIVESFKQLPIEFIRNPQDLGTFGNFNRCLDFAPETEYLHILHADDCIAPKFFEVMTAQLDDCNGRAMAWCLDERIDEHDRSLSISGHADGHSDVMERETFLAKKAEIANQAFCATLLKTHFLPVPERFPMDMMIFGDMLFWGLYGSHCQKLVLVHSPLAQYRWHATNQTVYVAPKIDFLVRDCWRTMQTLEGLRRHPPGFIRRAKLKGIFAVRCGISSMRFRQLGNREYAREIVAKARAYTGWLLWLMGQLVVQLRELFIFKLGRRPRHPQNIFS